ncbi:39S ribosomal protein L22 mitochondrial [Fasciola gigantica]|uniref:39S ribosomal protein L22 mitochondrial n=1 Tax=Fasciola gigantica TaxID=46835 RepID=A0A504YYE4_FASGI|nr:39S ribosomal protein L22 mitochondrial [Fasciola gigantica]
MRFPFFVRKLISLMYISTQVLEEAIELAVTEHDFEYSTKIWVETVHVSRGRAIPRVYKGVRTQIFMDNYHYADLFIRLREGDPPEVYHPRDVPATWTLSPACPEGGQRSWGSGTDILHRELNRLRSRRLKSGL